MGQPRRRFTWEFKVEAVRMGQAAGRSVADVARELGIRPDLRRELEVARPARDVLRQAAAFFAKDSR